MRRVRNSPSFFSTMSGFALPSEAEAADTGFV
jgi:hypothetical protein